MYLMNSDIYVCDICGLKVGGMIMMTYMGSCGVANGAAVRFVRNAL